MIFTVITGHCDWRDIFKIPYLFNILTFLSLACFYLLRTVFLFGRCVCHFVTSSLEQASYKTEKRDDNCLQLCKLLLKYKNNIFQYSKKNTREIIDLDCKKDIRKDFRWQRWRSTATLWGHGTLHHRRIPETG